MKLSIPFLAVALLAAQTTLASVVFDEAVSGDLADGNAPAPTPVSLSVGSNVVNGSVSAGQGDTRDYWTFTLPPGSALAAVAQLAYDDPNVDNGVFDGNRGFYALLDGESTTVPGSGFASLGGDHLDPIGPGANLLPAISGGGISGGDGFSLPLGPGTYTFQVQQTGPQVSRYSLDFVVIPEPATAAFVLPTALATMLRRRNRR
ncbi:MAG: hypothetical protein AAGJ46_14565 [Planctomycetota bacterium]